MIKKSAIRNYANKHPEKIAIQDGVNEITWDMFDKYTENLIKLINLDICINDKSSCLFISKNSMDVVLLGAALSSVDIPFQGVDYHVDSSVIKKLIKATGAKYVFISDEFIMKFKDINEICKCYIIEYFIDKSLGLLCSSSGSDNSAVFQNFKSYSFTSGTTGIPKIVYRTTSFDSRRFEYLKRKYHFNGNDTHLTCLPMYHVSSTGWLRLFLGLGCTIVIHNFKSGLDLCEYIHNFNITTTIMSPIMLKEMTCNLNTDFNKKYFTKLKFIITGGKNCPTKIKFDAIKKLGPIVNEYYGTTETGINTLISSSESLKFPGSVGKEYDGNKIIILGENQELLTFNCIGRIAIHSYMNMDGYLNHECDSLTVDGLKYLITSDNGYINPEGYLFVTQRVVGSAKPIVDLFKIENELMNISCISDAYVYHCDTKEALNINVVLNYYLPYLEVIKVIKNVLGEYWPNEIAINIVPKLEYTLTGKMRLPLTLAA